MRLSKSNHLDKLVKSVVVPKMWFYLRNSFCHLRFVKMLYVVIVVCLAWYPPILHTLVVRFLATIGKHQLQEEVVACCDWSCDSQFIGSPRPLNDINNKHKKTQRLETFVIYVFCNTRNTRMPKKKIKTTTYLSFTAPENSWWGWVWQLLTSAPCTNPGTFSCN